MLPGAGLYLPDSLYRRGKSNTESNVASSVDLRYMERTTMEPNLEERQSFDQRSIAHSSNSSVSNTSVPSHISTVFKFVDFASSLGGLSSESEDFIYLIQRVRRDEAEAVRLFESPRVIEYLVYNSESKVWIQGIISNVHEALSHIGKFMDKSGGKTDDGGAVALRRKFEWTLSHHRRLKKKQKYLYTCHQSLLIAIHRMQSIELGGGAGLVSELSQQAPVRPWQHQSESDDIYRGPNSRRKLRLSQQNLSLPSITISGAEGERIIDDRMNFLAELPGCTPDDPADHSELESCRTLPEDNMDYKQPAHQISMESINPIINAGYDAADISAGDTTTAVEVIAESSKKAPSKHRRSLDQISHPQSTLRDSFYGLRSSIDQPRRRAYSDQDFRRPSFDNNPMASFDRMQPLPTVSEKPIERHDSAASIKEANAVTYLMKRPKQIKVHPRKQHSSLRHLPYIASTPSLYSDLSEYVTPYFGNRRSYQSTDTSTSLETSTPPTSLDSSPVASYPPLVSEDLGSSSSTVIPKVSDLQETTDDGIFPGGQSEDAPISPARRQTASAPPSRYRGRSHQSAFPQMPELGIGIKRHPTENISSLSQVGPVPVVLKHRTFPIVSHGPITRKPLSIASMKRLSLDNLESSTIKNSTSSLDTSSTSFGYLQADTPVNESTEDSVASDHCQEPEKESQPTKEPDQGNLRSVDSSSSSSIQPSLGDQNISVASEDGCAVTSSAFPNVSSTLSLGSSPPSTPSKNGSSKSKEEITAPRGDVATSKTTTLPPAPAPPPPEVSPADDKNTTSTDETSHSPTPQQDSLADKEIPTSIKETPSPPPKPETAAARRRRALKRTMEIAYSSKS
ncbi:hypothetical protein BS50DRAFT_567997 [Corynespora cassiicola Philippines]|uniref:Uncharacterized protein n=1 Tax=Corynespora cassiicola Philippines TaxID=1448308 RepID=A0A2T2PCP3_CORCC|nr:hypothetical protein BS50DRAFT_567997 [Corynespora cassiicola Philippines]